MNQQNRSLFVVLEPEQILLETPTRDLMKILTMMTTNPSAPHHSLRRGSQGPMTSQELHLLLNLLTVSHPL